jgi:large subunit ribosomal protein L22
MSKKPLARQLPDDEAKAVIRHLRTSSRKLNLVAQMIRGMSVSTALTQLQFSDKRISNEVRKGLQSAIANAENNHNLNVDALVVKEAYVGKNMVMKRVHTRGRGRSAGIEKPFSNLTIVLKQQGAASGEARSAKTEAPKAKKAKKTPTASGTAQAKPEAKAKKPAAKKTEKKEQE